MSVRDELLGRVYVLLLVVVVIAIMIVYSATKINVVEGQDLRSERDSLYLEYVDVKADRGNILAADGSLLATSLPFFEIRIDMKASEYMRENFMAQVDSLAYFFAKELDPSRSKSDHKSRLVRAFNNGDRYLLIKKNVNYNQLQRLKEYPILRNGKNKGGLIIIKHDSRTRPFQDLAFRTIGLKRENATSVGLEEAYDVVLAGETGKRLMEKVPGNVWIPAGDLMEIEPRSGHDIVTTLDINMQDIAQEALRSSLMHHDADHGCVIVMETATGAIKAMANLGRKAGSSEYTEDFNYAIAESTEPGSTFKLASYMALFEDGELSLEDSVDLKKGSMIFSGQLMKDSEYHGLNNTTYKHAFEISSNVGVARLVVDAYNQKPNAKKFIERLDQFQLREMTGIELKGEAKPEIKDAYDEAKGWSKLSLPWIAHGYEIRMTPLQMLVFYNSIANGGMRLKPYLVSEIQHQGKTIEKIEPVVLKDRIASKRTIEMAQEMLEGVMIDGTGKNMKVPGMKLAGKTGTSRIEYGSGGSDYKKYQASFVGYFPADKPRYSCIVVVKNPRRNGYYGGTVAGRVFEEIAKKTLITHKDLHEVVNYEPKPVLAVEEMPMNQAGRRKDFERISEELNLKIANTIEADWAVIQTDTSQQLVFAERTVLSDQVPNVRGMGLRDAVYLLENSGLRVRHKGLGKVVHQSIIPGTRAEGQYVEITLK